MSRHSFFPLQFFMPRHRFECLDKTVLPFALINVEDRAKECRDILLQELLRQCHDIKIHCRDIVLSLDLHYVTT